MHEAADQHWSTRALDRQISVLYFQRLLAGRKKALVRKEASVKFGKVEREQFIRDLYVLELGKGFSSRRAENISPRPRREC